MPISNQIYAKSNVPYAPVNPEITKITFLINSEILGFLLIPETYSRSSKVTKRSSLDPSILEDEILGYPKVKFK